MAVQAIMAVLLASCLLETPVKAVSIIEIETEGFRVFRGSEQRELEGLSDRELLEVAAKFPSINIVALTSESQTAVTQEDVSLSLDCLPWRNGASQLQNGTIQWKFLQLDEFGNTYDPTMLPQVLVPNAGFQPLERIIVGGEFNRWLNITRVEVVGGAEDPDSKLFMCEVCVGRYTPFEICHTSNYTNRVIGAPPVIKETNANFCVRNATDVMLTQVLDCTILDNVPHPIPLPDRSWFRNGVLVASAQYYQNLILDMAFLMEFPIFTAGVFDFAPLIIASTGQLYYITQFTNITMPMLGGLPPDIDFPTARGLLFDLLLGNWTCVANNSLGSSSVEYIIRDCAPLNLPVPEVKALSCSVVLWESGLSDSDSSVSCEDIVGYDVRLYHPESEHRNVTRRVEADRTYYLIDDDDKLANINYETLVQVRVVHKDGEGKWSEEVPLGCDKPTEPPTMPSGVYFELNGKVYLNNSAIPLREIGEGDSALLCKTDRENCCGTIPNRFGEFYYPNGILVPIANRGQSFYRNRGEQLIRLNRRNEATSPTGKYHCAIPGVDSEIQDVYVTLTG